MAGSGGRLVLGVDFEVAVTSGDLLCLLGCSCCRSFDAIAFVEVALLFRSLLRREIVPTTRHPSRQASEVIGYGHQFLAVVRTEPLLELNRRGRSLPIPLQPAPIRQPTVVVSKLHAVPTVRRLLED